MKKTYWTKTLYALLLDSFDLFKELYVVHSVGVLDVAPYEQVEVLRRHQHAHEVQDAREVRERYATVVFGHLEVSQVIAYRLYSYVMNIKIKS